jgi:hypothetical protein
MKKLLLLVFLFFTQINALDKAEMEELNQLNIQLLEAISTLVEARKLPMIPHPTLYDPDFAMEPIQLVLAQLEYKRTLNDIIDFYVKHSVTVEMTADKLTLKI